MIGGRIILVLVCCELLLVVGGACAPPPMRPTAGLEYVVSVQVSNPTVWLGPVPVAARFPQVSVVMVTVQDAQGHPVDDAPVTFALERSWAGSATLSPSTARTRGGIAQALFFEPRTTGVVRIVVRVDGPTEIYLTQVHLTVASYEEPIQ
jgi:hypothetical protein